VSSMQEQFVMEQLSNRKVVVTGAAGFLGSHLTQRLVEVGAQVHGVSRAPRASGTSNIRWWHGSFEDLPTARHIIECIKPDVIFHLAGHVTAAPEIIHVLPTFRSLLMSTVHLLTISADLGCRRIVLTGSLTEPVGTVTEEIPGSPYAAAKWMCTAYARMFNSLYRTPVVVLRPFMTYGPRQKEGKIIPYVIQSLLRGEKPKLSSGQYQADWIYVRDVIDGLLAAACKPGVEGCSLDLGSGTLVSVRDIVCQLVELSDSSIEPEFGALSDRPLERVRVADIAETYRILGWRPSTSLVDGLRQTIVWYQKKMTASRSSV